MRKLGCGAILYATCNGDDKGAKNASLERLTSVSQSAKVIVYDFVLR
ncbi:hypothetical protein QFZ36_002154 [Pseudarthrobacter siccitolerans]|uniref:Uncharacterized protein n=1 Tax=Pseudarthrobacter siccitolerans TaxID=861266 RepID=A0ABU0PKV5_9MICC|nr:hypothetical protein [Pseudarthrobacter siccitolerans]